MFRAVQKIDKTKSAAQKKQIEGKACLGHAAQDPAGQLPEHAEYRKHGRNHGQHVGGAAVRPQNTENAGDCFAQKGIPEPMVAAQQGIDRRELSALRNVFNKAQMHGQVAVAALPGVQCAVHRVQDVGVQQIEGHNQERRQAKPHGAVVGIVRPVVKCPAAIQCKETYAQRQKGCTRRSQAAEAERKSKQGREGGQHRQAVTAAQRQQKHRGRIRKNASCSQYPGGQKQQQIRNADDHHTPSRSKGGVYSSRALLFSCM